MEPKFLHAPLNPLPELTELQLRISSAGETYELMCQLVFADTTIGLGGSEYRVGFSQARLQLDLEGCERVLGSDYGSERLPQLDETGSGSSQQSIGFEGGIGASPEAVTANVTARAGRSGKQEHSKELKRTHLPVVALPNGSWRIRALSAGCARNDLLSGTAIAGERLCSLERSQGGNRIAVIGELQVAGRHVVVQPVGGERIGKKLKLWGNKEAVIAKVLEKAMRREASQSGEGHSMSTVVVSKCEVSEQ
ncbi:MAG: hypothetical protein HOY44_04185 [Maritimibacter sp.]|uniref:hypothetical protein n=1 Tax=Maritimibacter sp. TaxID=2003363 RepID=UPI001D87FB6C|nr:hypothetical protein [Maritimibacter sp.]MBL6426703.1 hypothetical protein [Maritimibacter sp.]